LSFLDAFFILITKKYERGIWLSHYLWLSAFSAPPRDDFFNVFLSIPLNFKLLTAPSMARKIFVAHRWFILAEGCGVWQGIKVSITIRTNKVSLCYT